MDRKLLIVLIALVALVGVALIFMWQGQKKINKTLEFLTGGATPIEDADAEVVDSKVSPTDTEQEYEQEQQEEGQAEEQPEEENSNDGAESNSVLSQGDSSEHGGGEEEQTENEQEQVQQEQEISMEQAVQDTEQVTGDLQHEEQNTVQPVATDNTLTENPNTKSTSTETRPVRKRVRRTKLQMEEDRKNGVVKGSEKKTVNVSETAVSNEKSHNEVILQVEQPGAELMTETVVFENNGSDGELKTELPTILPEQKLTPAEANNKVGKYKKMQKELTATMKRTNVDDDEGSGESEDSKL